MLQGQCLFIESAGIAGSGIEGLTNTVVPSLADRICDGC